MNTAVPGPLQRILVVDDEPANVHVLAEALRDHYDVRFTTDGSRAAALAAELAVDLILLDVVMPDTDGYAVLRQLKDVPSTRHVPVMFVTAMIEIDDEERGLELGAVDYLTKPISPPIVRARVRTHLELKRQRDQLARLASLDGLTGIANRRRFDEEFDLRWRQAQRAGHALTIALFDVDHFKQYNDHYGHAQGDDCLRQVASALADCCSRADDLVARYGGEEFALVLPAHGSAQQLGRVLQVVYDLALPHARSSAADRVTLSGGAIDTKPDPQHVPAQALLTADRLLYQAKREGRDRCVHQGLQDDALRVVQPAGAAT
jgi:diguanylate cyclase (GGDEF)-like protein